jgi:5-formyltetrahydrofolate cyclo-ligase
MNPGKQRFDIRAYKRGLRERYKAARERMTPEERAGKDARILRNLLATPQYRDCATVLCYVSTPQEADTHALIDRALADGKRVAVPYCINGTRDMEFYLIQSRAELRRRTFGVLEPVPGEAELLRDFSRSVCILPGLSFDRAGYRLGYGGGYYDRFLCNRYGGVLLGVCYQGCTRPKLVHGRYDIPCDFVVTEDGVRAAEGYNESYHKKGR